MDSRLMRKQFRAVVKEIDAENFTVDAYVSTGARDRDDESILPDAWRKRLKSYREYPVFVSSHDYHTLTKVIGSADHIKVDNEGLHVRFRYLVGKGNPEADWAWTLASELGLAAFSVGFIPHAWDDGDGEKTPRRTYTDCELLEISQVVIPSNREALLDARSKGMVGVADEIAAEALDRLPVEQKESAQKPEGTPLALAPSGKPERADDAVAKEGDTPEVATKPGIEETSGSFRYRVRAPGEFADGTFRTVPFKESSPKINAVMGKLKGEDKMTLQALIFPKDEGWKKEDVADWIDAHKDDLKAADDLVVPFPCICGRCVKSEEKIDPRMPEGETTTAPEAKATTLEEVLKELGFTPERIGGIVREEVANAVKEAIHPTQPATNSDELMPRVAAMLPKIVKEELRKELDARLGVVR